MLIKQKSSGGTFVNIKEGTLVIKNKSGEMESFASIKGTIYKVEFIEEEFKGKKYEKAKIFLKSDDQSFILQMRTDSGYFRGFCNSLKSGNPLNELTISPSCKEGENSKSQTTCFINQEGKYLKHYFTKDFSGKDGDIIPQLERVEFKGDVHYDNSKQIAYWKDWLESQFEQDGPETEVAPMPEGVKFENDDDLPF
jgi:hypothetical protein